PARQPPVPRAAPAARRRGAQRHARTGRAAAAGRSRCAAVGRRALIRSGVAPGQAQSMGRYVVFSHGKEAGPWGTKISALAEIARAEGYEVDSVDYRGIEDPHQRVTRLLAYCRDFQGRLVLVGSSMGGHVSTAASRLLRTAGLFLMAPAF